MGGEENLGIREVWGKGGAFDLCGRPYLLIDDHGRPPSKRLIYGVEDIRAAAKQLKARGWKAERGEFEVPDGPRINFSDKSGNEYAILQMKRPYIPEKVFRKSQHSVAGS